MIIDLDFSNLKVLIVGAGTIANRKLQMFDTVPRELRIIATHYLDPIQETLSNLVRDLCIPDDLNVKLNRFFQEVSSQSLIQIELGSVRVVLERREVTDNDLGESDYILCCTDDSELNHRIASLSRSNYRLVNDVSGSQYGNVRNVAITQFENFVVAVSSRGSAPFISKWICEQASRNLGPELDEFVRICTKVRKEIRLEGRRVRDGGWESVTASNALALIIADEENLAVSEIRQCLL